MNKKALLALCIAVLLPLVSYLLVKHYSADAVVMPSRYYADSVTTKITDGKETTDTAWHKVNNISLTNQLGRQVSLSDLKDKIIVADFFFYKMPINMSHVNKEYEKTSGCIKN